MRKVLDNKVQLPRIQNQNKFSEKVTSEERLSNNKGGRLLQTKICNEPKKDNQITLNEEIQAMEKQLIEQKSPKAAQRKNVFQKQDQRINLPHTDKKPRNSIKANTVT